MNKIHTKRILYTVNDICRELNKDAVKKALGSVLQNDILNDIKMKFTKFN